MPQKLMLIVLLALTMGLQSKETKGMVKNDSLIGRSFPTLKAETLSGKTIVYPDSVVGRVAFLLLAFERQTQVKVDSWLKPFLQQYDGHPGVQFYEIPMLATRWRLIAPIIDGGMRGGIPDAKHDFVSTFYGNVNAYREQLGMTDKSDCYVFVLDSRGRIQWHSQGWASAEKIQSLFAQIELLLAQPEN